MHMCKRWVSCILTACLIMVCICSCKPSKDTWSNDDFELTVNIPKTTLKVGETMTVTAELKNIRNKTAHFSDNGYSPSIFFYVSSSSDPLNKQVPATLAEHTLRPNESITNQLACTASECGTYVLQVEAWFTIDGQEHHMSLEDTFISVVE